MSDLFATSGRHVVVLKAMIIVHCCPWGYVKSPKKNVGHLYNVRLLFALYTKSFPWVLIWVGRWAEGRCVTWQSHPLLAPNQCLNLTCKIHASWKTLWNGFRDISAMPILWCSQIRYRVPGKWQILGKAKGQCCQEKCLNLSCLWFLSFWEPYLYNPLTTSKKNWVDSKT